MEYVLLLILGAGVVAYFLFRGGKGKEIPSDVYVCDVCGEKDCLCHKVEKP
jgi:hypothetical protein